MYPSSQDVQGARVVPRMGRQRACSSGMRREYWGGCIHRKCPAEPERFRLYLSEAEDCSRIQFAGHFRCFESKGLSPMGYRAQSRQVKQVFFAGTTAAALRTLAHQQICYTAFISRSQDLIQA